MLVRLTRSYRRESLTGGIALHVAGTILDVGAEEFRELIEDGMAVPVTPDLAKETR